MLQLWCFIDVSLDLQQFLHSRVVQYPTVDLVILHMFLLESPLLKSANGFYWKAVSSEDIL